MAELNVASLKPMTKFSGNLMMDSTFLLCTPDIPLSESILNALNEWKFTSVYTDESSGPSTAYNPASAESDGGDSASKAEEERAPARPANNVVTASTLSSAANVNIEESLAETKKQLERRSAPENTEIRAAITKAQQKTATLTSEDSRMEAVQAVYDQYSKYIYSVFNTYATHKQLNLQEINETVKELCVYIRDNRRYVLRITPSMEARNKNFLVSHSMRTTVLALTIGLQLRMPLSRLVELGTTSILHEIGMLRLPPQIYMNEKPLTVFEKNQISTHPILGFNILRDANFPAEICTGVLEHHERETGTGYPQHLSGDKITMIAKIIAVACSFEAITAPRHFKEARTTYEAMIELLKNENHQYDDTVVKALLLSLSLYPIGAYVYLSNGRIAQVVDVTPGNPKNPVVQVIGEKNPDGSPKTVQTDDQNIKIARVMNKQEASDVLAALKQKQSMEMQNKANSLSAATSVPSYPTEPPPQEDDGVVYEGDEERAAEAAAAQGQGQNPEQAQSGGAASSSIPTGTINENGEEEISPDFFLG